MRRVVKQSLITALLACLLASLLAAPAQAAAPLPPPIAAPVISVHDGDTITVRRDGERIKVRLAEVDAPELAQAGGVAARRSLAGLIEGQQVHIIPTAVDRYGRVVGKLLLRDGTDVPAALVRAGHAWVYRAYAPKRSPLIALEAEARAARRGLWADPNPVPPWEWRKAKKAKAQGGVAVSIGGER